MILVDSNVIIDVIADDSAWTKWSDRALAEAADTGAVAINPIIYAEVSARYSTIEALEAALGLMSFRRLNLPYEAGFLAGKAFVDYRRRGGKRTSPLPDFYIGAHAAVSDFTLLTRDARRYLTYFPALRVISPQS